MRLSYILFISAVMTFCFVSCGEKKETNNIITHKPQKKVKTAPTKMQSFSHKENVEWLGKTYGVEIRREADTSLPMIVDETGNKYYDNHINIKVTRNDGTVFFEKTFSKEDFSSYITEQYTKKSALLGIVIDKTDENNLYFAASVGSPDVLSDEYMPLILSLSRMGSISIKKDTRLDSDTNAEEDEDYCV